MDGFARRKEQSKEDIRRAAWELFNQFGVDKVSIADIARKADVSPATIYNNFGNKEGLVREFVAAAVNQLTDHAQEILTSKGSYREKMTAFFQFISGMVASGRPLDAESIIFTSTVDLQNDPDIKKIRSGAQEEMTHLLLGLIREGKRQGQVNPDLSEEALGIYFSIFMDMFTSPNLQHQYHHQPDLVRQLGSLMIDGLSGRPMEDIN
jgi:AcrR family transcriptional regulator